MANSKVTRGVIKNQIDYYTPRIAFEYLLPFLEATVPKTSTVWEPCAGPGHITQYLNFYGWDRVISTDIKTGHDALVYEPEHYDVIVTNPPFHNKRIFIERFIALKKPVFLLLPTITLESNTIRNFSYKALYERGELGILLPPKMIHYIPKDLYDKQQNGEDIDCTRLTTRQSRTFFHSSWWAIHVDGCSGLHFL